MKVILVGALLFVFGVIAGYGSTLHHRAAAPQRETTPRVRDWQRGIVYGVSESFAGTFGGRP